MFAKYAQARVGGNPPRAIWYELNPRDDGEWWFHLSHARQLMRWWLGGTQAMVWMSSTANSFPKHGLACIIFLVCICRIAVLFEID